MSRTPKRIRTGGGAPTLDEVAQRAGVSAATVSRFINSPERVSPAAGERIRQAIAETGYVPNLLAGGLASQRSRLVAALAPTIAPSLFGSTIQAMTDALAEAGYQVVIGLTGEADQHLDRVLDSVLARRPDGLIVTGTLPRPDQRQRLIAAGIPIIETWDLPRQPIDMAVGFSHEAVGRALAEYVLQRGYRRPWLFSAGGVRALARRFGFTHAMVEQGRPEPPYVLMSAPTTLAQGRQALAALLDRGERPDVVVCSSDWAAHGVIAEAARRGLSAPRDLAVVGFGDLEFAADMNPSLTTVRIDGAEIGRQAAGFLLRRARGEEVEAAVDVGFTVVPRESA